MKLMILPSWYPNKYNPGAGIFIKNQAEQIASSEIEITVLGGVPVSFLHMLKYVFRDKKKFKKSTIIHERLIFSINIPYFVSINLIISYLLGLILFQIEKARQGLPDLIHVHTFNQGLLALFINKRYSIPIVVTEHFTKLLEKSNLTNYELKLLNKLYTVSNYNIAVSKYYANFLDRNYGFKFHAIPNYIEPESFSVEPISNEDKSLRILSVGTLKQDKGMHLILEALQLLCESGINANVKIIGSGKEDKNLVQQAKVMQLENRVQFISHIPNNQIPIFYQQSSVLVSASRHETFGITMLEAISCGIPVISTSEAPKEFIIDGFSGFNVDRNAQALAEALEKLFSTRFDRIAMHDFVCEKYSSKVIVAKLRDLYSTYKQPKEIHIQ
ncbi:MAG: glycosyltransferase [Candidatus Marinimicrobia bacterium]|nr:glycosyltransferase [Candidatus Neomarinimicrobiota bacterium]